MNFYIAHILDSSLDRINLYNVTDKNSSKKTLNSIGDLEKINDVASFASIRSEISTTQLNNEIIFLIGFPL